MGDCWKLADIEVERFAAAASLFAIHTKQQSVRRPALILPNSEDGDSSEEDIDDDWQTTMPYDGLYRAAGHTLKDRFLDRLSEVLAREKTTDSRPKQSKAKHVAATAWINSDCDSPTTILLAKNEGLDERDRRLSGRLQAWLRAVSVTGKAPTIEKDTIWFGLADKEGLVEYSRCRLEYYVSQIRQWKLDVERLGTDPLSTSRLQHLCRLCCTFDESPTTLLLSEAVNLAFELRYTDWRHPDQPYSSKVSKAVWMLGRLRVAYECFKTTALSFPELKSVVLKPVDSPTKLDIDVTKFRKEVRSLAESVGRKRLIKSNYAQRYLRGSWLHVHSEMQILVYLESETKWRQSAHRYIGTSKKPCFLCNELLRNYTRLSANGARTPAFRARVSHGKVYPLWTLPTMPAAAESSVSLCVAAALIQTHRDLLQLFSANSTELQPAIAESSVGMSEHATVVGKPSEKLKREYLARERDANSCTLEDDSDDAFGQKVQTVQVIQLPADGSEAKLVPITFHALLPRSKCKVPEVGRHLAPDFRKYWASCHSDRKSRQCTVENQPIKEIEGDYWIYRNTNIELLENAYVKRMLGIDSIDQSRLFYYGDVFIVKFTEHPETFAYAVHDIPEASALQLTVLLKEVFSKEWHDAFLESELQSDQYFEAQILKLETDKEILYERMTPIERELLKRMPPNALERFALQLCDDDSLVSSSVRPSKDPGMVEISVVRRPRVLDQRGWTGFQSSQL